MTTISAGEFNRDVSAAKRAAELGPVTITDRGKPAYVLLTAEGYEELVDRRSIVDWIAMAEDVYVDVDFSVERSRELPRDVAW